MSENLYLKYRPSKLSDVVGQDHIKQYLTNATSKDKISHAYLLAGSHGIGKTSLARIMALIVNNENGPSIDYDINSPICQAIINGECPDVHEMDAASNSSVENMRDLRSLARNVPVMCRKRIFIIDEFQAVLEKSASVILKTLESPSPHVMFILATTDPQKVLATIQSRCQRFDLSKLTVPQISSRLEYICEAERVPEFEKAAIDMIAKSGEGSLRNAISSLETVLGKCDKKITVKDVQEIVKTNQRELFTNLIAAMYQSNHSKAILLVKNEINKGTDPEALLLSFLENFHDMLIAKLLNNNDIVYIEEFIKPTWNKCILKLSPNLLRYSHKTMLSFSLSIKNSPRVDFLLDQSIIELVEVFEKYKEK